MSVKNATLLAGATGVTITGGTSKQWTLGGQTVRGNGVQIVDTTATDYRTRPHATLRSSEAVYNKAGICTEKAIRRASITRPKLLADGVSIDFPNGEVIMKIHPEMLDAEILEIKLHMVQTIMDPDFDNFWKFGSTE